MITLYYTNRTDFRYGRFSVPFFFIVQNNFDGCYFIFVLFFYTAQDTSVPGSGPLMTFNGGQREERARETGGGEG